jgi:hypothetical protein
MISKTKINQPMTKQVQKQTDFVYKKNSGNAGFWKLSKKRRFFEAKRIAKTIKKGFRKRLNLIKNWRFLRFA